MPSVRPTLGGSDDVSLIPRMKALRFHPEAESEMIAAAAYYEAQQPGLGRRFLASVQDSINRIRINSHLYPIVELDVRRCLTNTFPFGQTPSRMLESTPRHDLTPPLSRISNVDRLQGSDATEWMEL